MKQNEFVFLLISSFILIVCWVGFNLYNKAVTTKTSETLQLQVKPIEPSFDTTTLNLLKTRQKADPIYQLSGSTPATTPSPTPSPASSGAKLKLSPTPKTTVTPTPKASLTVTPKPTSL